MIFFFKTVLYYFQSGDIFILQSEMGKVLLCVACPSPGVKTSCSPDCVNCAAEWLRGRSVDLLLQGKEPTTRCFFYCRFGSSTLPSARSCDISQSSVKVNQLRSSIKNRPCEAGRWRYTRAFLGLRSYQEGTFRNQSAGERMSQLYVSFSLLIMW